MTAKRATPEARVGRALPAVRAAIQRYRETAEVGAAERRDKLQSIRERAASLQTALEELTSGPTADPAAVMAIRGSPPSSDCVPHYLDPTILDQQLRLFCTQLDVALKTFGAVKTGPHYHSRLRQLLLDLSIIWAAAHELEEKGVKRVRGESVGPMLDWVYTLLLRARVPVQSKNSVADKLYEMRALITKKAAAHREKRVLVQKETKVHRTYRIKGTSLE